MLRDHRLNHLDTQSQIRRKPLANLNNRSNANQCPKTQWLDNTKEKPADPNDISAVRSPLSTEKKKKDPGIELTAGTPAVTALEPELDRNPTMSAASSTFGKGKRKTHIGPWQLGKTIGNGSTCRVRLAKHAVTGQTAAVKIVSKRSATMVQSESVVAMDRKTGKHNASGARQIPFGIEREVIIMKLIDHPNVIRLYDVWENRGEIYLVLEYVDGGELFDYISDNGALPEEKAVRLFRQLIAGLSYCHRFNICHRDLKPENILLDSRHNVKLADFGMAAFQPSGHWLNTSCGSPHYASPEIIHGRKYRGDRADVWSCGIILFALLAGFLPFDGSDIPATLRLVKKGEYSLPTWLSNEASDLIQCFLKQRPEDRIDLNDVWAHPLFKKYERFHQKVSDHYVGPPPPLSTVDCGPLLVSSQDVDNDILQNLQKLWHGVKPEELVKRLLAIELNHERMLYTALVRFKEEQLENFQGYPFGYSASDYHHISQPAPRVVTWRNQNNYAKEAAESNYSIPTRTKAKLPPTVQKVSACQRKHLQSNAAKPRYPQPTTHTTARKSPGSGNKKALENSTPVNQPQGSKHSVYQTNKSKTGSVNSIHSKLLSPRTPRRGTGPPPTYARSASYRRNVTFRHLHKYPHPYNLATLGTKEPYVDVDVNADSKNRTDTITLNHDTNKELHVESSPPLPPQPTIVRRNIAIANNSPTKNAIEVKKLRSSKSIWEEQAARKASSELSQICEEAFNGASSSSMTAVCDASTSPCTYVESSEQTSTPASTATATKVRSDSKPENQQPTPKTPTESPPTSSNIAKLAESRRKLIQHSTRANNNANVSAHLSGIISHLDRLIEQQERYNNNKSGHRANTAVPVRSLPNSNNPDPFVTPAKNPEHRHLSVITEESATPRSYMNMNMNATNTKQAVDPITYRDSAGDAQSTIRVVPRSSSANNNNNNRSTTATSFSWNDDDFGPPSPLTNLTHPCFRPGPQNHTTNITTTSILKHGDVDVDNDDVGNNNNLENNNNNNLAHPLHELNRIGEDEQQNHQNTTNTNTSSNTTTGILENNLKKWCPWLMRRRPTLEGTCLEFPKNDNAANTNANANANNHDPSGTGSATVVVREIGSSEERLEFGLGDGEDEKPREEGSGLGLGLFRKLIRKLPRILVEQDGTTTQSPTSTPTTPTSTSTSPTTPKPQQQQQQQQQSHSHSHIQLQCLPPLPLPTLTQTYFPFPPLEKAQNFLARFLQISPATHTLALKTTKSTARRRVYKKLVEWMPYGLDWVFVDGGDGGGRVGSTVTSTSTSGVTSASASTQHRDGYGYGYRHGDGTVRGRVGERNFLHLRPVEFTAEFYTILEHGRHADLSIVRFRQDRGAASTFRRVVDTLRIMLERWDMLVEDPVRARAMAGVLDG